ncbi:MAG: hypothetical protein E7374_01985 [Clostridiales bacterium]|nr:hypothetical protein [Clostridiales bacterium]
MLDEVLAYFDYLEKFKPLSKPKCAKFDIDEYNDSNYISLVNDIVTEFDNFDDLSITLTYLKGD